MFRYIRIPTEVEAFIFNPDKKIKDLPNWFQDAVKRGQITYFNTRVININTIGKVYIVHEGDYIVKTEEDNIIAYTEKEFNKLFKKSDD